MSQVINNLIINANQAMPDGGIIKIHAENVIVDLQDTLPLTEGNYVKISIIDQGMGIPEKYLKKIFDPYFTTKQEGSGLGLATTFSIIKKHNGYITVESELGKGTNFFIFLPASEEKIIQKTAKDEKPLPGQGKILFMDDEKFVRKMAKDMLGLLGYKVVLAKDGSEMINLYTNAKESDNPFKAVIMDLSVPGGLGGKEAIKKLIHLDPKIKAVVSSGYATDPIMANFQDYGFSGVIVKPYKIQDLSEVLHKVLVGSVS